ncbi:MAG: hypothetical protein GPJ23_11585 [Microcystis aeruginosa G13-05]|nr:hypothetical protein [Microcystis aeruginosa G13-05]
MIQGEFNSRGELFFEVGLLSADGEIILVMALLDRQFKNEVHQCLMIIHRIPQKGFDSQDIFEDDD